jgi:hypothetical protein
MNEYRAIYLTIVISLGFSLFLCTAALVACLFMVYYM